MTDDADREHEQSRPLSTDELAWLREWMRSTVDDEPVGPYDESREDDELDEPVATGEEQSLKLPPPHNWWIKSPGDRVVILESVARFLARLHEMYELGNGTDMLVMPCWYLHPGVVQELIALWQYRNEYVYIPEQTALAAIDFHVQFEHAIRRIRARTDRTGCEPQRHVVYESPAWLRGETDAGKKYRAEFGGYTDELDSRLAIGGLR